VPRAAEIYLYLKGKWGLSRFLGLTIALFFFTFLQTLYPQAFKSLLAMNQMRIIVPAAYLLMYVVCFTSYSKIYKFKVFLTGHLFLAIGLFYYYLNFQAYPNPTAWYALPFLKNLPFLTSLRILVGFTSFNIVIITLSPLSLRYRLTRFIALFMFFSELVLCTIVLFNISKIGPGNVLIYGSGYMAAIYFINLGALVLSIIVAKDENSFGGIIASFSVANILIAHGINSMDFVYIKSMFTLMPSLVLAATLYYWFSCLHHRVAYDPLLKIYNREYAHAIISGTSRVTLGRPFTVAMIDIDRFKKINDTYGHQVGDEILVGTAQCIKATAMPTGITCRYGGEEIIVFLCGTGEADALAICEKIRRKVREVRYQFDDGRELAVSVSIGLAECDDPEIPLERVVKAADEAVYVAKDTGRNKVVAGKVTKRNSDQSRKTYLFMRVPGRDRRNPEKDA